MFEKQTPWDKHYDIRKFHDWADKQIDKIWEATKRSLEEGGNGPGIHLIDTGPRRSVNEILANWKGKYSNN